MPTPYLSSVSGRVLLCAFASFMLSAAAYLLYGNMAIFGLGFPLGLTLSFLAVGFGMTDYTKETMLSMLALPPGVQVPLSEQLGLRPRLPGCARSRPCGDGRRRCRA